MNYLEMKKSHAFALNKAESIVRAAESAGRELTEVEAREYEMAMAAANGLAPEIAKRARQSTLRQHLVEGKLIPAGGNLRQARTPGAPVVLSEDYYNAFHTWIGTRGQEVSAALYEGSGSAGGFIVPLTVEGQVIPLAPQEMGVRTIASVVATAMDIKLPRAASFGAAALKAESGATDVF